MLYVTTFLSLILTTIILSACGAAGINYGSWEITKEPTCLEEGITIRYAENNESIFETKTIAALGHDYDEWENVIEPTYESAGLKRKICKRCGDVQEEEIPHLAFAYVLTCQENGKTREIQYLDGEGAYSLTKPEKYGYEFCKYVDQDGNDFALQGNIYRDVIITPIWNVLPTVTFQELKDRVENGASDIFIAANIELTDTVFIDHSINIYCDQNITLTRSKNFGGFLFVIGKTSFDESINLDALDSKVKLYTVNNEAQLIFDGNKTNIADVYGSAFLITNSCTVDVEDGVVFQNFKKTSNRTLIAQQGVNHFAQIGGSCFIIGDSATLNINGGEIKDNESNIDETLEFNYLDTEDVIESEADYLDKLACSGGAIYNNGTLNIYGGKIVNNTAARGGAIFNYKNCNIYGGVIENNQAELYGGAIYLPASQKSMLVIGHPNSNLETVDIYFNANISKQAGGAIFGQTVNDILVYGGVKFYQNISESSNGGAIATSGSLILKNSIFEANAGNGDDSKGGAVYSYAQDNEKTARQTKITNCRFVANVAAKGGALGTYSAADDVTEKFVTIIVTDCIFDENKASAVADAVGGAIYLSKNTQATLDGCEFNQNTSNKNGGAIYNTASLVEASNCTFTSNSSGDKGGAIAVHSAGNVVLIACNFKENIASANGGALYLYGASGVVGVEGDAESPCRFEQNQASGGGAIYITATDANAANLDIHSALFEGNIASSNGGALYCYTNATVNIGYINLDGNTAGNYGGAFYISGKAVVLIENLQAKNNEANKGGVVYITTKNTKLTILAGESSGNTANDIESGYTIFANVTTVVISIKGTITGEYFSYETDGIQPVTLEIKDL